MRQLRDTKDLVWEAIFQNKDSKINLTAPIKEVNITDTHY